MTLNSLQIDAMLREISVYEKADIKLQRGYVSRKPKDDLLREVYVASGSRKGQYYILVPNYQSTQYCYRQYLKKVKRS